MRWLYQTKYSVEQWKLPKTHRDLYNKITSKITRLNVASNKGASIYMTENLTEFKGEIDTSKIIFGHVNIPLSEIDRIHTEKMSKWEDLNNTIKQCDLTSVKLKTVSLKIYMYI